MFISCFYAPIAFVLSVFVYYLMICALMNQICVIMCDAMITFVWDMWYCVKVIDGILVVHALIFLSLARVHSNLVHYLSYINSVFCVSQWYRLPQRDTILSTQLLEMLPYWDLRQKPLYHFNVCVILVTLSLVSLLDGGHEYRTS